MAEAIAAVGLLSAIAQLIDLSSKVLSRMKEFADAAQDTPESFQTITTQLPLFQDVLKRIQTQCSRPHLRTETAAALSPIVTQSLRTTRKLDELLTKALGPQAVSDLRRPLQAIKSLLYDSKLQHCLQDLNSSIQLLMFHQSTTAVDSAFSIHDALSNLSFNAPAKETKCFSLGLNLGNAPQIDPSLFVGREREIETLRLWLSDPSKRQRVVSIVGAGGLGKTQLSLTFADRQLEEFSSILWLNAKDQGDSSNTLEDDRIVQRVRSWLSEGKNIGWLLIYDNYDTPNIACSRGTEGYDLRKYFPFRSQGSILITTRSHRLAFSRRLKLDRLVDSDEAIALLSARCERELDPSDKSAKALVKRLGGMPLALATAGDYLRQTCVSVEHYLLSYERHWDDLKQVSDELTEYEERTLFSTWNLSFDQVKVHDPDAAEFLRFLAYFGNEDLWYDLFNVEIIDDLPWLAKLTTNVTRFNRVMGLLHDYCLVETAGDTYSLHTCVHDWVLHELNPKIEEKLFRVALRCVADNVHSRHEAGSWRYNQRLLHHAERFQSPHFRDILAKCPKDMFFAMDLAEMGKLWQSQGRLVEAEAFHTEALTLMEDTKDNLLMFETYVELLGSLGGLYRSQGRVDEAETVFWRLHDEWTRLGRARDVGALEALSEIAVIKLDQAKVEEAEALWIEVWQGIQHRQTSLEANACRSVINLGILCHRTGKFDWANFFYSSVLTFWTTSITNNDAAEILGLYFNVALCKYQQGLIVEAEELYKACLERQEVLLPLDCPMVLSTVSALGILYRDQRRVDEGESISPGHASDIKSG